MNKTDEERQKVFDETVHRLADPKGLQTVGLQQADGFMMPSVVGLKEAIDLVRSVIFPGYFEREPINPFNVCYHLGVEVERLHQILREQIVAGFNFACDNDEGDRGVWLRSDRLATDMAMADRLATSFVSKLTELRDLLTTDVVAAYNGDPAAKSYGEIIFCYPVIKALLNYRMAHALLVLGVPLIPRIITEMAHSETGIDIHPGAQIGKYFTIDHGTGVVIGETAIIGNNVKLYQGVTLGAKSFPLDGEGNPIKSLLRHPILEDNVIVYSNASILGRITIGHDSIIGGNMWIDRDVPAGSKIFKN